METPFTELGLDSVEVARAIRFSGQEKQFALNMTQINKLLYILYGNWLVKNKQRLTAEAPSAWPYGPVFPNVHRRIALYDPITDTEYKNIKERCQEVISMLDAVVQKYGHFSAGSLSEWSHKEGSPWHIAVMKSNGKWNTKIADTDIYNYFYSFKVI